MRLIPLVSAAFVLLVSAPSFAQGWIDYASPTDFFTVNFPGQPAVRDITYTTEYRVALPGRVYSAENGRGRYSVTVVDYTNVEEVHAERLANCEAPSRSNLNLCNNPWVGDLEGAIDYAAWSFLQRDAVLTHYGHYRAERVEGRHIQLTNADESRTFVAINMHESRLYILEGTVPRGAPPPGLFQQSLGFLDGEGIRVRYETTYSNRYAPPPRVQYGQGATGVPDLSGVQMGDTRTFTDGPFAGQTWGVDGSGGPFRVEEGAPTNVPGFP